MIDYGEDDEEPEPLTSQDIPKHPTKHVHLAVIPDDKELPRVRKLQEIFSEKRARQRSKNRSISSN